MPQQPPQHLKGRGEGGAQVGGAPLAWRAYLTARPALAQSLAAAWRTRQTRLPAEITFARPAATLPVSLTGTECPLACAHCNGHYLRHMASLQEALARRTKRSQGATSFLVSGGCVADTGRVPFVDHLADLAQLRTSAKLNFHVGLVDESEASQLTGLADVVSFDVVGDDVTIREVLHLDRTVADYRDSLAALRRHVRVVPHVLAGLHGGQLRGERQAIDIIAGEGCTEMVVIVLIPTPGTAFAAVRPPEPADVAGLLAYARSRLPDARIGLGCMRPAGAYRAILDPLAVHAGVQTIVQPAPQAVAEAARLGLAINYSSECCVL